ncbi:MAG: DNA mismatch repair endonuclease MutL, partial [Halobacteria archaeon]|nr:DNA mismatch repair endonuclease MutL [Halobacteria archaeon]
MTRIRKLDSETIERIAAGEVVRNPASVVKELVENSLDAGATDIDVRVENSGLDSIRVADDGEVMTGDDALLAFERHATSKIEGADDIERVDTLGFRGEALPSIAKVSKVELTTKPADGDGVGATRVVIDDTGDERVEQAGRGVGTTVEVRDLFYNTPARRKSLSSPRYELSRISDLVTHYALAHPNVAFTLEHGESTLLSTPGTGRYTDAILETYGKKTANRTVEFEYEYDYEDESENGKGNDTIQVEGILVRPSVTRSEKNHVYTAVNGRALSDKT